MATVSDEVSTDVGMTKLDLAAMRQADRVSFHHVAGNGTLRCTKQVKNAGPYDDRERDYEIACASRIVAYSPTADDSTIGQVMTTQEATAVCSCFAMLHSAGPYTVWPAVCAIVRAGDRIRFKWVADSCNGYMKDANRAASQIVHFDQLEFEIVRDGRTICTMPIADSHCPNNSARMIRGL